jgi:hypothetical protein
VPTTRRAVKKSPQTAADNNGHLPVVFEEPPPATRGTRQVSKFLPLLEAARQNPGKSVKISSVNTSVATNIRKGKYQGVKEGEFEVVTRKAESVDGKHRVDIYVRVKSRGRKK